MASTKTTENTIYKPTKNEFMFFGKSENINMVEHIAEVDAYDETKNIVSSHNVMTIYKLANIGTYKPTFTPKYPNETDGYIIPYMGIASTNTIPLESTSNNKDESVDVGSININLNNFDVYGEVRDTNVINTLKNIVKNRKVHGIRLLTNYLTPAIKKMEDK